MGKKLSNTDEMIGIGEEEEGYEDEWKEAKEN